MMMDGAEWSSFNGANSVNEEANFMAQLFPNCSLDSNDIELSNAALSSSCYSGMTGGDNGSYFSNDDKNSNFYCLSQGSSSYSGNSGNVSLPFHGTYSLSDAYEFFPVEYCPSVSKHFVQHFPGNLLMERNEQLSLEMSSGGSCEDQTPEFSVNKNMQTKQECDQMSEVDPAAEDRTTTDDFLEYGRKRSRISEKGKRNIRTKKNQKNGSDDDEENHRHPNLNRQNSSSCSEEECNGSQELSGVASSSLSSKGTTANDNRKTRASRGAATDPQSLYARKRRERINERLKILQNLVPNGTKVDISTMLEEAVHYVKFLQHQIKLLSSDELWMYAPLAYNGVDIGLDPKIRALL